MQTLMTEITVRIRPVYILIKLMLTCGVRPQLPRCVSAIGLAIKMYE